MKTKRMLCLALAFLMLMGCLVACNNGTGGGVDGGEVNGNWANLDFKGETLTISVSKNDPNQVTFKNAGVYTKGPDNQGTSEPVQK